MTFVVTEACIKCKLTDCVEVCPVDCFHEGPNFLVIDPDECIDCTLCEPECPVEAIYSEDELPADQQQFLQGYLPVVFLYLFNTNANTVGGGLPVLTGPGIVDASNAATVKELSDAGTR